MEPAQGALAADAALDPENIETMQTPKKGAHHVGEDFTTAAKGGIGARTRAYSMEENEPLLGDAAAGRRTSESSDGPEWPGARDFEGLPWWKRPSIFWILPPFLLYTLSFGGILVPKTNLILELICREYLAEQARANPALKILPIVFGGTNPQCETAEIQARVAKFSLYGNLISGLLAAIVSPKLGALSDRYGRKKIIALSSCGSLFGELITILAATRPDTFPVNWILCSYALDGLFGSFTTAMALIHSYATDCTSPAKRSVTFGYFHGCLFTGIAIGPLIAGTIIKKTGSILSIFYIGLGCHLLFISCILLLAPESLTKSRQMAAREKRKAEQEALGPSSDWINQLRSLNLFEPLKILYPTGPGTNPAVRRNLVLLAAIDTVMFGVAFGSFTVITIYCRIQFGWKSYESSIFMSIVNTSRVTCLIVILPLVTRWIRGPNPKTRNSGSDELELNIIRIAVFFDTLGYIGFTLSRTGSLMILSGVVASLGGIGSPTLQAALTKHVPSDRTGQLLGATGLLHASARVVAPTIFNGIYAATVGGFRQTVFVCLTATFGAGFLLSWFLRPHIYVDEDAVKASSRPDHEHPEGPLEEEVSRL